LLLGYLLRLRFREMDQLGLLWRGYLRGEGGFETTGEVSIGAFIGGHWESWGYCEGGFQKPFKGGVLGTFGNLGRGIGLGG